MKYWNVLVIIAPIVLFSLWKVISSLVDKTDYLLNKEETEETTTITSMSDLEDKAVSVDHNRNVDIAYHLANFLRFNIQSGRIESDLQELYNSLPFVNDPDNEIPVLLSRSFPGLSIENSEMVIDRISRLRSVSETYDDFKTALILIQNQTMKGLV